MRVKSFDAKRCLLAAAAALTFFAGCNGAPRAVPSTSLQQSAFNRSRYTLTHSATLPRYEAAALTGLGGVAFSNGLNNNGWVTGTSYFAGNVIEHAVFWRNGKLTDLGTLGGQDSGVDWNGIADTGEIAGVSELARKDPYREGFCGKGPLKTNFSPRICIGFRWSEGVMSPLQALGGNNAIAADVNDRGLIIGTAETAVRGKPCGAPQVLEYRAVIWEPDGMTRALRPIAGDDVSQAVSINDSGESAGASGPCGPPHNPGYGTAHAILWQRDGTPKDLGNLGGTTANAGLVVNNNGDVAGISALAGNSTVHAFLWRNGVMRDLGTLPGDVISAATGLNDDDLATGQSCSAGGACRAVLWKNGMIFNLNHLVNNAPFVMWYASYINEEGMISGITAYTQKSLRAPAFLATPDDTASMLREALRPNVAPPPRTQTLPHQFVTRYLLP
jgi:probable HAF family extracellular repeat protein